MKSQLVLGAMRPYYLGMVRGAQRPLRSLRSCLLPAPPDAEFWDVPKSVDTLRTV